MLIHELTLRGLLSFGPDTAPLKMQPLNVLIGPNGSGKSNLIEAISLLRSSATKLTAPIRGGGGVGEWIWKGAPSGHARIEAVIENPAGRQPLRHAIEFAEVAGRFELLDELIEDADQARCLYLYEDGPAWLRMPDGECKTLDRQDIALDQSILSQRKDPDQYPELGHLAGTYEWLRLYREWSFGQSSVFRRPQAADLPSDRLEEDFSNLGLFLNHLRSAPKTKGAVLEHLRALYAGLGDFDVRVKGGTVEVFLTERDYIVPASRLSDGTLRYLCLLAILCDPDPPPLVCIEEPELGLHPDILPQLVDLMIEASQRTQLVVTTHSDVIVDSLTDRPESVVVVEKHEGRTTLRRLETAELKSWLDKYRLGELWTRGEIGGTRW